MANAGDRTKRSILDFIKGAGGEPSRLWIAGAAICLVIIGSHSCASIEAGQVGAPQIGPAQPGARPFDPIERAIEHRRIAEIGIDE